MGITGTMTKLSARSLIGFREVTGAGKMFYAENPATGEKLQPGFASATAEEVELAVRLAAEAFEVLPARAGTRARSILAQDCGEDRVDRRRGD